MDSLIAVSLALLTALLQCSVSCSQTGIKRIPAPNGSLCLDTFTATCNTTGRGEAEVNISTSFFRERHSQYPRGTPDETVRHSSDGEFTATNLLRSDANDSCYDPVLERPDSCFTTEFSTRVNETTRCHNVTCSTLGDSGTTVFDTALVERKPESPYNLKAVNQSIYGFTATWMPLNTDCPSARFEVTTTNCGSCNSTTIVTTTNDIRCNGLTAVCRVSVRSVSECGSPSESVEITVEPLNPMNSETDRNVHIGVGVGVALAALVILAAVIVIVVLCICRHRNKSFSPKPKNSTDQPRDPSVAETSLSTAIPHADSSVHIEDTGTQRLIPPTNSSHEPPTISVTESAPQEAQHNNTSFQADPDVRIGDTSTEQLVPPSDSDRELPTATTSEAKTDSEENDGQSAAAIQIVVPPSEAESAGPSTMIVQPGPSVKKNPALPSRPHADTEAESTAHMYRGLESVQMASEFQHFPATVQMQIKPNADVPTVGEVLDNSITDEKVEPDNEEPRSKSPISNHHYSLSDDRKLLIAQACDGEDDTEPVESDEPSQPASTASAIKLKTAKKGIKPEQEGPSMRVAANQNYTAGGTPDHNIPEILKRLDDIENERYSERITQLETYRVVDQATIQNLHDEISKLKEELSNMKSKYADLEKVNETERIRHKEREKELEDQITHLTNELKKARAQIEQLQAKNQGCQESENGD